MLLLKPPMGFCFIIFNLVLVITPCKHCSDLESSGPKNGHRLCNRHSECWKDTKKLFTPSKCKDCQVSMFYLIMFCVLA